MDAVDHREAMRLVETCRDVVEAICHQFGLSGNDCFLYSDTGVLQEEDVDIVHFDKADDVSNLVGETAIQVEGA